MWLLGILPAAYLQIIIYSVFLLGIAMYIGSFFSNVIYTEPLKIIAVLCMIFGIYVYGCVNTELYWRDKVVTSQIAYQKKIDAANIELTSVTTQLVAEQQKKQQVIIQQHDVIKNQILTITEKIDSICKVDSTAIQVLNDSAQYPVKGTK